MVRGTSGYEVQIMDENDTFHRKYYVGEPIPWSVHAGSTEGQIRVELQADDREVTQ